MFDSLIGNFGVNDKDYLLGRGFKPGGRYSKSKEVLELSFTEDGIESTFDLDQGDVPGFNEIGDSGIVSSLLYDSFGNRIGSSESEFELVQQLDDGSFIANVTDTFNFGRGNTLTVGGQLNVQNFESLEPTKLRVIEGSGIYDDAIGKAILQQQQLGVLDVINVNIQVIV
jgi:hypothetical protein